MFDTMNLAILVASLLVVVSIFTSLISFRVGAPLLLVFLLIGLGAGEDGLGRIVYDDADGAYFIGSVALAIILFDSGFATSSRSFRAAAAPAIMLATVGVVLTAGAVGAAAYYLFGLSWLESLLLGAIISSTDAAAVFFLLRVGNMHLRDRVRSTLEVESSSNDPMAIFLTVTLVELIASGTPMSEFSWAIAQSFAAQIGLGALLGALGGLLIVQVVNRVGLEQALYPIMVLGLALLLFSATSMLGGSGFLAVYIAGVISGNSRMRQTVALRRFQNGLTWLSQIAMFLTLGLLATPSEFPAVLAPAVVLALLLTFVARPLVVWLCLLPFGFDRYENAFIGWVGLRGAVSILLAVLPTVGGLENGQLLFNAAFVMVLTSLLLQGWTILPIARWLGLVVPPRQGPLDRLELEIPGSTGHELVTYRIHPDSPVGRGERIPRWARPALIVRDGRSLRVGSAGRLQPGDSVHIITPQQHVPLLDRLFAGRAEVDENDPVFYGDFGLAPEARIADVAHTYSFPLRPGDDEKTVADILRAAFGSDMETGDRYPYGPVELIVRNIDDDHKLVAVGLAVEQSAHARPRLPLFHGRREIADFLRNLRQKRKASGTAPADQ